MTSVFFFFLCVCGHIWFYLIYKLHTHSVAHDQEPSLHPISMGGGMAFELELVGVFSHKCHVLWVFGTIYELAATVEMHLESQHVCTIYKIQLYINKMGSSLKIEFESLSNHCIDNLLLLLRITYNFIFFRKNLYITSWA